MEPPHESLSQKNPFAETKFRLNPESHGKKIKLAFHAHQLPASLYSNV
jgi:hypothetical protein